MKLNKYLILIVVFSIISINNLSAKYTIKLGIYVTKISINKSTPFFESEFYWWMKFNLNNSKIDTANPLSNIEFVNGENIENRIMEKKVIGNEYYVVGKMKGSFSYKTDYRNYPFDRQNLEIIIENTTDENDECKIFSDSSAFFENGKISYNKIVHDKINLEGISLNKIEILENEGIYNTDFGDQTVHKNSIYSRLIYKFEVKRNYFSYFLKLIIPLFIIVALAYLVFFIPSQELEVAASLTVTSLIAAVAFQITVADDIPTIGYMTSCDLIFYLSYMTIMIAMIQTIYSYKLEVEGKVILSNRLDIIGRYLLPVFYFTILIVIILHSIY